MRPRAGDGDIGGQSPIESACKPTPFRGGFMTPVERLLSPSDINRPTYSRAPRPPAPPPEPERGAEWSPELIARWERIARQPGHPEARIAGVMLAACRTEATPPPPGGPAPDAATRAWTTAPSPARLDAGAARVAGEGPSTDGPGRPGGGTHVR